MANVGRDTNVFENRKYTEVDEEIHYGNYRVTDGGVGDLGAFAVAAKYPIVLEDEVDAESNGVLSDVSHQ